ncbi:MAG: inositol monophosphatase [Pseudomonadota bacterium]
MELTSLPPPLVHTSSFADAMGEVLQDTADRVVLPRFQRLAQSEIAEKLPGDLVTVADREAELLIARGLAKLDPFAHFVGEESCAEDPSLLSKLDEGSAWIVDPIDGTGNYAAGRAPFAMMAAYLRGGELVASAILDPLSGRLITAERGAGAWSNGQRTMSSGEGRSLASLQGVVSDFQRPAAMEPAIEGLEKSVQAILPTRRCAGAEYPMVASGKIDFALYWRTLVWDHAPGVLILQEAGGKVARLDGTPYRAADPSGAILLAHSPEIWDQAAAVFSR